MPFPLRKIDPRHTTGVSGYGGFTAQRVRALSCPREAEEEEAEEEGRSKGEKRRLS